MPLRPRITHSGPVIRRLLLEAILEILLEQAVFIADAVSVQRAGKKLRLKQQYFFSSATLQDLIRTYKKKYGSDFSRFSAEYAIQLNDTHPTVAIPEFIRLMMEEGMSFARALKLAKETFAYTNHTIMAEALEKWGRKRLCVIPFVLLLKRSGYSAYHSFSASFFRISVWI